MGIFKNEKLDSAQTPLEIARRRTQDIDATKSVADYEAEFCRLRQRFGSAQFLEMSAVADKLISSEEQARAAAEEKKRAAAEAEKVKNSDFSQFMRALQERAHSTEPLAQWCAKTSASGMISTLQEFQRLAAGNGLKIREDLVKFGLHFLASQIALKLP